MYCTWEALELRKRPQCLYSDSVFAVGHSIFHEQWGVEDGGVLDTELIILTALLMLDNKQCCGSYPQNTDARSLLLDFLT